MDIPGRQLEVRDDDRFVVSYPRSGNTWVRFLIANLISDERVSFLNIERIVPDIYQNRSRSLRSLPGPRYLKSHEPFDLRYPTVLYLVRDPRDVCVSYYYYLIKMGLWDRSRTIQDFTLSFLRGEFRGHYGSWRENVGSWLGAKSGGDNFLLARYEDILQDTAGFLSTLSAFLGVESTVEELQGAIERSSLSAMQQMEERQSGQWRPTRDTDPEIRFVRGQGEGGWRDSLPRTSADAIYEEWGELMEELGYST